MIQFGVLLWVAERLASFQKDLGQIGWVESQLVGLAQAVALIPGSSRSGTTMTAAMLLGLTREAAARFSFLLRYLRRNTMYVFIWYRIAVGLLLLTLLGAGVLKPLG